MGYSRSKHVLERMLPTLQGVTSGDVHWRHPDPAAFAYKVREALYIARLFPQDYPDLAAARGTVSVDTRKQQVTFRANGKVLAFAQRIEPEAEPLTDIAPPTSVAPTAGRPRGRPSNFNAVPPKHLGPRTVAAIVEAWDAAQESPYAAGKKLVFESPDLGEPELNQLARWAAVKHWMVIASPDLENVTLLPRDPDLVSITWPVL